MEKIKYANFRGIKKIDVIEVHVNEGEGVPSDPCYREVYYVRLDTGEIIGHHTSEKMREHAGDR